MEKCNEWIFTWYYGQKFPDNYVKIKGTYDQARKIMKEHFGDSWACQLPITEEQKVRRDFKTEISFADAIN